jgi:outer membrane autotransporter protein
VPALVGQSTQASQQLLGQLSNAVSQRITASRSGSSGASAGDPLLADQHWWVKTVGTRAEQEEIDRINGYDLDSYSLTIGYDGKINDDLVVGAAFSYTDADIDGDTITSNRLAIEGYQLSAYLTYALDETTFVDALASFGSNSNESRRQIAIGDINGVGSADYDSWYGRLYGAVGRDYALSEQFTLTPTVSLAYTYIDEDSYTEKGLGDIGLAVKGRDADFAVAALNLAGSYRLNEQHRFSADVGFGYQLLSTDSVVASSFIGGGAVFKTKGPDRAPENYRLGLGYQLNANERLTVNINYDYEAAQGFDNQLLSATARYLW